MIPNYPCIKYLFSSVKEKFDVVALFPSLLSLVVYFYSGTLDFVFLRR